MVAAWQHDKTSKAKNEMWDAGCEMRAVTMMTANIHKHDHIPNAISKSKSKSNREHNNRTNK
jgi:hypothetical protein